MNEWPITGRIITELSNNSFGFYLYSSANDLWNVEMIDWTTGEIVYRPDTGYIHLVLQGALEYAHTLRHEWNESQTVPV